MNLGDWAHLERNSQFNGRVWSFSFNSTQSPSPVVLVLGDSSLFNNPTAQERLVSVVARIESLVSDAACCAMQSPYRLVIDECGGIACESVVVETWDQIRVWFRLKTSGHRLLGVRMLSGIPTDVYCDHP
ncbi:MAG: hypothetical protein JWM11_7452 [Planctomycetaceae bacterium]|nr:hypothetical protein [Planctomycetaceae bacterium]